MHTESELEALKSQHEKLSNQLRNDIEGLTKKVDAGLDFARSKEATIEKVEAAPDEMQKTVSAVKNLEEMLNVLQVEVKTLKEAQKMEQQLAQMHSEESADLKAQDDSFKKLVESLQGDVNVSDSSMWICE